MTSDLAKARYTEALDLHVLPDLGAFFVDQIRDHDLEAWLVKPRKDRRGGKYSPHTVNGWWRVLKMVLQAATRRYYLYARVREVEDALRRRARTARLAGRLMLFLMIFEFLRPS
jgi:hypothetical protein